MQVFVEKAQIKAVASALRTGCENPSPPNGGGNILCRGTRRHRFEQRKSPERVAPGSDDFQVEEGLCGLLAIVLVIDFFIVGV
ncbi:MAG: hypothetical protein AAAB11_19595, partial [Rhizobium giardinii]